MPISNPPVKTTIEILGLQTDVPFLFPGGRLTLSSNNPLGEGYNASTLYYQPFIHGVIPIFDDVIGKWVYRTIPPTGLAFPIGSESPRVVDVYAQPSNDEIGWMIALQGWTNETERLRELKRKDGILTVSFPNTIYKNRTYLGSLKFSGGQGTAKMQDHVTQRFVFNSYNQVQRRLYKGDSSSGWSYQGGFWRSANGSDLNRVEVLDGIGQGVLDLRLAYRVTAPANTYAFLGLGINATGYSSTVPGIVVGPYDGQCDVVTTVNMALGASYIQAVEYASVSTVSFNGAGFPGLSALWMT